MVNNLLYRLFGVPTKKNNLNTKTNFKSIYPENQPSFNQWCRMLNVSAYYDRSRRY
jgi:hypothetical protein